MAHDTPKVKRTNVLTNNRTNAPMLHIQQTPGGGASPRQKTGAAGSLVLTLNVLPSKYAFRVTHGFFTYLVGATVTAPYMLCIMVFGLMLMWWSVAVLYQGLFSWSLSSVVYMASLSRAFLRRAQHLLCNCFGVLGMALQSCWRGSSECVGFDSRGLLDGEVALPPMASAYRWCWLAGR